MQSVGQQLQELIFEVLGSFIITVIGSVIDTAFGLIINPLIEWLLSGGGDVVV
ncbi:MAG: hypothetical protein L6Q92_16105 [Phycisphaerae bacterium]|nr:hypothetical protein [Phycisphaerae bacterium]